MAEPDTTPVTAADRWTRRDLLRSGLATSATLAGAGLASGQETTEAGDDILTPAVIGEQQEYDQSVVGFFIHVGGEVDPIDASVDDECDFASWPQDRTVAYDAEMIDRTAEPQQSSITLYLRQRVDVVPGTLFIVNNVVPCDSGYVGLRLERIGVETGFRGNSGAETTVAGGGGGDAPNTTATDGTGFGVLGALAGALGAGWLLGRDRER
jgi:hypothetical protein